MNVFELFGKVALDGSAKVKEELTGLEKSAQSVSKGLKIAGAAFTAIGVAGLAMVDSAREINAKLAQIGITTGLTTKELRDMVLGMADVSTSTGEATATLDILSRAGVTSREDMLANAKAFDTLADATGSSADVMAEMLLPVYRAFGQELPKTAEDMDKFTWLTKNTTVDLSDFATVVQRLAPDMQAAGISMDDAMIALMGLEAKGITGREATTELGEAIKRAAENGTTLATELGLTTDEVIKYQTEMEGATGITDDFAEAAETQYGIMDKIKSAWDKVTLAAGSFLTPLEPILSGMTALGPMMIFLSTSAGTGAVKWGLHTAALVAHKIALLASAIAIKVVTAAQWLWNAAMSANPIGIIILAIAALIAIGVLLWQNWDWVKEKAVELWNKLKEVWNNITGFIKEAWEKIVGFVQEHWDMILAILFPAVGLPLLIARHWGAITEVASEILNRVAEVFSGIWEAALEWGKNLVEGLWEGIKSLSGWIWDKVEGFARGIYESIKDGLGDLWPFSPSEAGVNIGKGLSEGIRVGVEKAMGDIRSAMGSIESEITLQPAGAGSGPTSPARDTTVNNYFQGPWFIREEADIHKIARDLYRLQTLRGSHG